MFCSIQAAFMHYKKASVCCMYTSLTRSNNCCIMSELGLYHRCAALSPLHSGPKYAGINYVLPPKMPSAAGVALAARQTSKQHGNLESRRQEPDYSEVTPRIISESSWLDSVRPSAHLVLPLLIALCVRPPYILPTQSHQVGMTASSLCRFDSVGMTASSLCRFDYVGMTASSLCKFDYVGMPASSLCACIIRIFRLVFVLIPPPSASMHALIRLGLFGAE